MMYKLSISGNSGPSSSISLVDGRRYICGKGSESDLIVSNDSVSRTHAEIESQNGEVFISDQNSTNGTWINGERLVEPRTKLAVSDSIVLGTAVIILTEEVPSLASELKHAEQIAPVSAAADDYAYSSLLEHQEFIKEVHQKTLDFLDLHKRSILHKMSDTDLRIEASKAAEQVLDSEIVALPKGIKKSELIESTVAEAVGLGPLEPLLADESITEIMVNGYQNIYVERDGKLQKISKQFNSASSLMSIIERIVTPLGRRIDEGSPMVDARLKDGSRVNAIIAPLALNGATLTIRKFSKHRFGMDDLLARDTLSPNMGKFLEMAVHHRRNMLVSGGTGSGKTTTLNVISNFIPSTERIVTIEDAAELQLNQDHVISLESRPKNIEGKGEVLIRDLVKNSLRMRPDRIVVGECRGGEALDMLQAMNTGHDGSLTTGHANSPRDLLSRLEVMVLMSGVDLPVRAIREQIASAVDIVLQQTRFSDGSRRITSIYAIDGMEGDVILMQKLFEFVQTGLDENGTILGHYQSTGEIPKFYSDLENGGVVMDRSVFVNNGGESTL
ncbi:MAG: Flp pilus assembly complex ATPase component TadA [Arenicella sp.]|nr:Flp pilus assembly complex ATPase component TadA [Arenicella sp.]